MKSLGLFSPPPLNHVRFRALPFILRGAGPRPLPSKGEKKRGIKGGDE